MRQTTQTTNPQAGFSLMELMVAMCVMVFITGAATSLLVGAFSVRTREDERSEAIGDVRRALNILSRELANSGYQLPPGLTYNSATGANRVPANGLIPGDCDDTSITFVANLNASVGTGDGDVSDMDEALTYQFTQEGNVGFLVRRDLNGGAASQTLANNIDGVQFDYLTIDGTDTAADVSQAARVRITVWADLNPVGQPGTTSYQPPSQVRLASEVDLRNVTLGTF
ncbi:MAG TPA: prepilin-type N-terminal cleavage/methylation domain-containing protein [Pyrinomonadaceae bacterium]|jgi:prepilin-type N-terminal cleavage/methylation domain-containing protein|nr:prepilin-type N-terminal cleavage/methylation domain-containing protein [Pyrinomonadaceae bacterium]